MSGTFSCEEREWGRAGAGGADPGRREAGGVHIAGRTACSARKQQLTRRVTSRFAWVGVPTANVARYHTRPGDAPFYYAHLPPLPLPRTLTLLSFSFRFRSPLPPPLFLIGILFPSFSDSTQNLPASFSFCSFIVSIIISFIASHSISQPASARSFPSSASFFSSHTRHSSQFFFLSSNLFILLIPPPPFLFFPLIILVLGAPTPYPPVIPLLIVASDSLLRCCSSREQGVTSRPLPSPISRRLHHRCNSAWQAPKPNNPPSCGPCTYYRARIN